MTSFKVPARFESALSNLAAAHRRRFPHRQIETFWYTTYARGAKGGEFEVRDGSRLIWANDTVLERLERYAPEDLAKLEAKLSASETEIDAALIDNP